MRKGLLAPRGKIVGLVMKDLDCSSIDRVRVLIVSGRCCACDVNNMYYVFMWD